MRYLKLFEGINDKGWEIVFDPNTTMIDWNGLSSYLHDKPVVELPKEDIKKIINLLSPYVPLSDISVCPLDPVDSTLYINTHKSAIWRGYKLIIKEYYDSIEIIKLDDEYFIVSCSYQYTSGSRTMVFKCDEYNGLSSLLTMMFKDFPKMTIVVITIKP